MGGSGLGGNGGGVLGFAAAVAALLGLVAAVAGHCDGRLGEDFGDFLRVVKWEVGGFAGCDGVFLMVFGGRNGRLKFVASRRGRFRRRPTTSRNPARKSGARSCRQHHAPPHFPTYSHRADNTKWHATIGSIGHNRKLEKVGACILQIADVHRPLTESILSRPPTCHPPLFLFLFPRTTDHRPLLQVVPSASSARPSSLPSGPRLWSPPLFLFFSQQNHLPLRQHGSPPRHRRRRRHGRPSLVASGGKSLLLHPHHSRCLWGVSDSRKSKKPSGM